MGLREERGYVQVGVVVCGCVWTGSVTDQCIKKPGFQDPTLFIITFVTLGKLCNMSEFLYFCLLNEDTKNCAIKLIGSCENKIKHCKRKGNK